MDFSADGALLLTSAEDGTARMWDTASGEEVLDPPRCEVASEGFSCLATGVFLGHKAQLTDAELGPGDSTVLTADIFGTAQIWDAATRREPRRAFFGHEGRAESLRSARTARGS